MKQTLLSVFLASTCLFMHAQLIDKGDKLIGGNFYLQQYSGEQATHGNINMVPSFSWGAGSNKVIGIKGGISYSRSRSKDLTSQPSSFSFGVFPAVFFKKYKPITESFGIFFAHELNGNYLFSKQNYPLSNLMRYHSWAIGYTFNPGVVYRASKRFLAEASIGGAGISYSSISSSSSLNLAASFLQYVGIGVNYIITKHREL